MVLNKKTSGLVNRVFVEFVTCYAVGIGHN